VKLTKQNKNPRKSVGRDEQTTKQNKQTHTQKEILQVQEQ
jgi:hypothetical protein